MLPFLLSFFLTCLLYQISGVFREEDGYQAENHLSAELKAQLFTKKDGQLFLKRHGIQEDDKSREFRDNIANSLKLSIRALAKGGFKQKYRKYNSSIAEAPGTIWPWPRIESDAPAEPLVWVVTPTYRNAYQYAELTRIAQAIYPARKFVRWIVVDDTKRNDTKKVKRHISNLKMFLDQFIVNCTLLQSIPRASHEQVMFKPKGVEARRTAIQFIREQKLRGVVYFADDDNVRLHMNRSVFFTTILLNVTGILILQTYDSDIFRQV